MIIMRFVESTRLSFALILLMFLSERVAAGARRRHRRVVERRETHQRGIGAAAAVSKCSEPENLKDQILGNFIDDDEMLELDDVKEHDEYFGPGAANSPRDESKICEQMPEKSAHASVMQRSLCPWQWRTNFDESREPKFIFEAECLCRKSRGLSNSYCQPIRRRFAVLRRSGCNSHTKLYEYTKSVEVITVGCHSVLPRSQKARPLSSFYDKFAELDI